MEHREADGARGGGELRAEYRLINMNTSWSKSQSQCVCVSVCVCEIIRINVRPLLSSSAGSCAAESMNLSVFDMIWTNRPTGSVQPLNKCLSYRADKSSFILKPPGAGRDMRHMLGLSVCWNSFRGLLHIYYKYSIGHFPPLVFTT